jgi:hypothetical protein
MTHVDRILGNKLPINNPIINKTIIGIIIFGSYELTAYIKIINAEVVINKLSKANLIVCRCAKITFSILKIISIYC